MSVVRCFLCTKTNKYSALAFESIGSCRVPASEKPIRVVLQHLANCIKTKLVFREDACICAECFKELSEYDNLMINLLSAQKQLTQRLQLALSGSVKEEHIEIDEQIVVMEEDSQLEDVFNPELDTKEEFIEVDEAVLEESQDEIRRINEGESDEDSDWAPGRKRSSNQECVICGVTFKSKLQLQNHINVAHNSKSYVCNICGAVRRDEEYLELHMNTHEGKTENECRYCPKRFTRPVNTLRHMRKHWDKKKYQCEKCGERFSLDNMLYNHRMRHEAEENPLICSICNQSFKSRKTYNHHMVTHQENRPRHHCTLCAKSFTERYTLKMHMKTHVGQQQQQQQKPVTPIMVEEVHKETEAAVTALVSKFEDGVAKDFQCVICSTAYQNKEALEEHLQADHDVILK